MKKTTLLAASALLVFASGAWAAPCKWTGTTDNAFCDWNPGCYAIDDQYSGVDKADAANGIVACAAGTCTCANLIKNCTVNGTLYTGTTNTTDNSSAVTSCDGTYQAGKDPGFNDGIPIWCLWASGCQSIKSDAEKENCIKNGSVFKTVPSTGVGDGKTCQGGTWTQEGRDPNAVMLGCCNWDNKGCFAVYEAEEWAKCKPGERWTTCSNDEAGTCPATGGPSSSSNAVSSSSSNPSSSSSSLKQYAFCILSEYEMCMSGQFQDGICLTVGVASDTCPFSSSSGSSNGSSSSNGDNDTTSSSSGIDSSTEFAFCVFVSDRICLEGPFTTSNCPTAIANLSNSCPYPSSSSGGNVSSSSDGSSPVVVSRAVRSNMLTAMQNAVNLQSTGNATIQIFNLKGNAVRTLKFSQGSYVVPLTGLPKGLYIVKASNASWKQTIKATVK